MAKVKNTLKRRVQTLEDMMAQLVTQVYKTARSVNKLSIEMAEFKKDMNEFKQEMSEFKKEMSEFKNEMIGFKNEMAVFKDEMAAFKDEMAAFKNEMLEFKAEQDREHKRMNREWSNLAKKMGTIVEDLIAPALGPVLGKYFNCQFNLEGQRMRRRLNDKEFEIDAIAVCDDKVFMVEVKSTPRHSDIADILDKAERFYDFFPEYKSLQLVKILGSITFDDAVIRHASKNGIYVLGWREWEYMDILNFDQVNSGID